MLNNSKSVYVRLHRVKLSFSLHSDYSAIYYAGDNPITIQRPRPGYHLREVKDTTEHQGRHWNTNSSPNYSGRHRFIFTSKRFSCFVPISFSFAIEGSVIIWTGRRTIFCDSHFISITDKPQRCTKISKIIAEIISSGCTAYLYITVLNTINRLIVAAQFRLTDIKLCPKGLH